MIQIAYNSFEMNANSENVCFFFFLKKDFEVF